MINHDNPCQGDPCTCGIEQLVQTATDVLGLLPWQHTALTSILRGGGAHHVHDHQPVEGYIGKRCECGLWVDDPGEMVCSKCGCGIYRGGIAWLHTPDPGRPITCMDPKPTGDVISPDCRDSNHQKCDGVAWDLRTDAPANCNCTDGPHATGHL